MKILFYCGIHNLVNFSRLRPYYDVCYGFDANPEKVAHARAVYKDDPHVKIVHGALTEKGGGEVAFTLTTDWDPASSLGDPNPEFTHMKSGLLKAQRKIMVPALNLHEFCVENGITEIDTLVTDLQGMDFAVLKTLGTFIEAGRIREIQCEVEPDETPPRYLGVPSAKLKDFQSLLSGNYEVLWQTTPDSGEAWEMDVRWRAKGGKGHDDYEFIMKDGLLSARAGAGASIATFSQCMEDLVIDALFSHRNEGFYVDVGANDPEVFNNTRLLYGRGWRGVNIEPEPGLHALLVAKRERDINLNVGVGSVPGTMTFYRMSADTLSSFNKEAAIQGGIANGATLISEEPLPVMRLADLLDTHGKERKIDFMSVDAEGYDLEVLKSNDWTRHRPSVIMVEINIGGGEIVRYLEEQGYTLVFDNDLNGIFLSREFYDSIDSAIRADLAALDAHYNLKTEIPPWDRREKVIINFVYEHLLKGDSFASHRDNISVLWSNAPIDGCDAYVYHNAFSYRGPRGGIDILLMLEPAVVLPGEFDERVWDHFEYILTLFDTLAERDKKFTRIDFPHYGGRLMTAPVENQADRAALYPIAGRRNAVCMINGNKRSIVPGELYSRRIDAATWFHAHSDIPFDVFGNPPFALPNYKGVLPQDAKLTTLAQYRYCLCFENTNHPALSAGYVTEKILDCLNTRTVPIYLGASNVEKYIPASCFIDFRKFKDFAELDQYLHALPEKEYGEYIENIDAFVTGGGLKIYATSPLYDAVIRILVEKNLLHGTHLEDGRPWTADPALVTRHMEFKGSNIPVMWTMGYLAAAPSPILSGLGIKPKGADGASRKEGKPHEGIKRPGNRKMLKVLYAGKKYAYGSALKGYDYLWWNLYDGLTRFDNVHARFFDYVTEAKQRGVAGMSDLFVETVRKERPDLVLYSPFGPHADILPEALRAVTMRPDTQTAMWMSDDLERSDDYLRLFTPAVDYVITVSDESADEYERAGFGRKLIRSQWAFNPFTYHTAPGPRTRDVSFVGAARPARVDLVKAMRERGLIVEAFGAGWQGDIHIPFDDMVRIFGQSRVNLDIGDPSFPARGIRRRTFEAAGCRGFLITTPQTGLQGSYEPDREVVVAGSLEELADKTRYYLAHDGERETIAQRAYARTLEEHTWSRRLAAIFTRIGFDAGVRSIPRASPSPYLQPPSPADASLPEADRETGDMPVSIGVMGYNKLEYTRMCVESILHYTPGPFELLLMDNGSTDGTGEYFEAVKAIHPATRVFRAFQNRVVEELVNRFASVAQGKYLVFASNDILVHEGWLENLIRHMETAPDIGMVGPRSNSISGPQAMETEYDSVEAYQTFAARLATGRRGESSPARRVVGMLAITKKAILKRIGGWDPELPTNGRDGGYGFSDDDLSIRMLLAGYRILIAHDVLIHHFGSVTVTSQNSDVFGTSQNTNMEKYESKLKRDPRIKTGADGNITVVPSGLGDPIPVPGRCLVETPRACLVFIGGEEHQGPAGTIASSEILIPVETRRFSQRSFYDWIINEGPSMGYEYIVTAPVGLDMPVKAINELLDAAVGYPDVAILVPQDRARGRADSDRTLAADLTSVAYADLFVSVLNMRLVRPHLPVLREFTSTDDALWFLERRLRGEGYFIAVTSRLTVDKGRYGGSYLPGILPETLVASGKTEEAARMYLMDVTRDPSFVESWRQLAVIHLAASREAEAITCLTRILEEADKDCVPAYLMRARIALRAGNAKEAQEYLLSARSRQPKNEEVLSLLDECAASIGHPSFQPGGTVEDGATRPAARDEGAEEMQAVPGTLLGEGNGLREKEIAATLYGQAVLLQEIGRTDLSARQFEIVLEIDATMAEAHNDLGVLCFQGEDMEKALAHLREAVDLEPDNIGYRRNIAGVLLEKGHLDEAVVQYQAVLTREPDDVEASLTLARLCSHAGLADAARSYFNKVLEVEPDNAEARQFFAQ